MVDGALSNGVPVLGQQVTVRGKIEITVSSDGQFNMQWSANDPVLNRYMLSKGMAMLDLQEGEQIRAMHASRTEINTGDKTPPPIHDSEGQ